jgi:hypothetical protein
MDMRNLDIPQEVKTMLLVPRFVSCNQHLSGDGGDSKPF